MLPKKNRANSREINEIFKKSRVLHSQNLTLRYLKINSRESKISFIAPKNVAKLAVKRNLLRRRGYNALKKHLGEVPSPILGAVVFKKYIDDLTILQNEIKELLHKIN